MPNRPYILDELTWKTVRDTRYEVAILPWGATEAHNYHLSYTTDNIQAEEVVVGLGGAPRQDRDLVPRVAQIGRAHV